MPMQMPRKGTPAATARRASRARPASSSAVMHGPKAPTPGNTRPSARLISDASAVRCASAPTRSSPFCAVRRLPMP